MEMEIRERLSKKKAVILKKWLDMILKAYPADSTGFLKKHGNQFTNPAGNIISRGLEDIFNDLLSPSDSEKTASFLDNIIRARAVQEFTPSEAVSFIFSLKKIIREELGRDIPAAQFCEEMEMLESRIDAIALTSFDIFMKCREKLYDIKANEMRSWTSRLVERADKIYKQYNSPETTIDPAHGRIGETADK